MSGSLSFNDALVVELIGFCRSESLSADGLREIIESYECEPNNNHHVNNYNFIIYACHNELVTEGILRCLLEYFPDAAGYTCPEGSTPLHELCFFPHVTRGMVQLLVDASPESIDAATNRGNIPLHILCINKKLDESTAVDILGFFLERCPEAAQRAGDEGILPIHAAVGNRSLEFCRMLIEAYPGSERITNDDGNIPFHMACGTNDVALAEYLYKLYPESIDVVAENTNEPAFSGLSPIHFAVIGGLIRSNPAAAVEMVQFLLDCDPNVSSQKFHGNLPLYWACNIDGVSDAGPKVNAALKIAQALYDARPEAIFEDDEIAEDLEGFPEEIQTFINTQLTYARLARNSTVRLLNTPDENGQVPLHRVLHDNITLGSIKLLVKRNPSVLLIPDNCGTLPLHMVCQHNDSSKVVDYLIGLDSNTLSAVDREGNTALHIACQGAKYDTIALLLEKYDAVSVSQSNALNKLPIHLLLESKAVVNREDTKYLESVFQLLRAYPETVMVSEDAKQVSLSQVGRPSRNGKKRKYCA